MSKWVGYAVSVNCGEPLGCYQGTILEADGNTITLTKAFRNGFPYPKSQVTLNAADIRELRIIEQRAEPFARAHSTVAVSARRGPRATVCETLQANPGVAPRPVPSKPTPSKPTPSKPTPSKPAPSKPTPSKPVDIAGRHSGVLPGAGAAKARFGAGDRRRRHEAFLGDCAAALAGDFDFEGNLALFDKQALWQQMRSLGPRPDVVADAGKLRHDENVLAGGGGDAGIAVPPALRGERDYVTDDGARVPSVGAVARRQLWRAVRRRRLLPSAAALLARAVADVALRLVGGERRLDPRNSHQAPVVVALVGAHGVGAAGLLAARLLASHGARAACLLLGGEGAEGAEGAEGGEGGELARAELAALELADVRVERHAARLPRPDLVLLALHDPAAGEDGAEGEGEEEGSQEEEEALRWVRAARAGVVALEPPARGWAGVAARAAVVGGLPPSPPPPGAPPSHLHLANVGLGAALFASLGIAYRPPFGAAAVLALHPADD